MQTHKTRDLNWVLIPTLRKNIDRFQSLLCHVFKKNNVVSPVIQWNLVRQALSHCAVQDGL